MRDPMTDIARVEHVLEAIQEIEKYLHGITVTEFMSNSEKRFATIKQIEIIGEACDRISRVLKDANADIQWKSIKGFRNISIHEYFGVNFQIVWEITQFDLPRLKERFSKMQSEI